MDQYLTICNHKDAELFWNETLRRPDPIYSRAVCCTFSG